MEAIRLPEKLKMVHLFGWIFMILLHSMASSGISLETDSEYLTEATLTTIGQFNETENITSILPLTSPPKASTDANPDSSSQADMGTEITRTLENSSSVLGSAVKPISMSLKADIPVPAYLGDISTTLQSTSTSMKESLPHETQGEGSTFSDSDLYYDPRTTTEHILMTEVSVELPDMVPDDDSYRTTPPMGWVTEKTGIPKVVDEAAEESKFHDEITRSTKRETGVDSHESAGINTSPTVTVENETKIEDTGSADVRDINFGIESHKTVTEVEILELQEKQIGDYATENTSFVFKKSKDQPDDASKILSSPEESMKTNIMPKEEVIFTDHVTAVITDFGNISADATETLSNYTRNPKHMQREGQRTIDKRFRPPHPDPVYVSPYRPEDYRHPYYGPSSEHRTSVMEDKLSTRPPRPNTGYQRVSFKPNYAYSKPSQAETSSSNPSTTPNSTTPRSYRPSYRPSYKPSYPHPYRPQTSFGQPYRPVYHGSASQPADDHRHHEYSAYEKTSVTKGTTIEESEVSEHSRADFNYSGQSESVSEHTKTYHPSDAYSSSVKTDSGRPYYPTEFSMHTKATEVFENRDSVKVPKPDMVSKGPSTFHRPAFENTYPTPDSTLIPFSGTITSTKNLTRVEFIKADCFDNYMKVTMRFNGTFNGLVYSSGYTQDPTCSYVNGSGRNHYEFFIRLNRCGTLGQQEVADQELRYAVRRRQERAQYLVNTVTVQYNPVIEEDIDEHFRVTCEYGYDFWKTVSFPIISVESNAVKFRSGNPVVFTLPPPQLNMEIRKGYGPSGLRVTGPVTIGDPLTLVIHMKSESIGFDILVSNCFAHNGAQRRLPLIDANGCVVDDKMVSPFKGVSSPDRSQQVTLYTYLKAFRFTGSPALYIECDVHMCHGSCPPQRCYWRHVYKRSAEELTAQAVSTSKPENIMSDSISLFQVLEVRNEDSEATSSRAHRITDLMILDDLLCMKAGGFAAVITCILLVILTLISALIVMCIREKKWKKLVATPAAKLFCDFNGHVPLK